MKSKKILQVLGLSLAILSVGVLTPQKENSIVSQIGFIEKAYAAESVLPQGVTVMNKVTVNGVVYALLSDGNAQVFNAYGATPTVTIPESVKGFPVTSVGNYAFAQSSSPSYNSDGTINSYSGTMGQSSYVKKVSLPPTIKNIGTGIFSGSKNSPMVYLPATAILAYGAWDNSISKVNYEIYQTPDFTQNGFYYLKNAEDKGTVTLIRNPALSVSGTLTIPSTVQDSIGNDYTVTKIGGSAFERYSDITGVVIPNTIKEIGATAFDHCTSLTSISVPDSVTNIGSSAFADCSNLTVLKLPTTITGELDYSLIGNDSKLTSVKLSKESLVNSSLSGFHKISFLAEDGYTDLGDWLAKDGSSLLSAQDKPTKVGYTFDKWVNENGLSVSNITSDAVFKAFYIESTSNKIATPILTPSKLEALNRETDVNIIIS